MWSTSWKPQSLPLKQFPFLLLNLSQEAPVLPCTWASEWVVGGQGHQQPPPWDPATHCLPDRR